MFFDNNNSNVIDNVVQINDFFFYNKEFKVLICSKCHVCVMKNKVKTHLNLTTHLILSQQQKTTLILQINNYEIKSLTDLQQPTHYQHCFSFLTIYNNALQC